MLIGQIWVDDLTIHPEQILKIPCWFDWSHGWRSTLKLFFIHHGPRFFLTPMTGPRPWQIIEVRCILEWTFNNHSQTEVCIIIGIRIRSDPDPEARVDSSTLETRTLFTNPGHGHNCVVDFSSMEDISLGPLYLLEIGGGLASGSYRFTQHPCLWEICHWHFVHLLFLEVRVYFTHPHGDKLRGRWYYHWRAASRIMFSERGQ